MQGNLLAFSQKDKEKDRAIKELKKNPPHLLLTDQLQTKQKEVESLRAKLEATNAELNSLQKTHSTLLDTNLTLKHHSLKDWWKQYEKTKELEQELKENMEYASEELISQDKQISSLEQENSKLKLTNQSLQKDLNLTAKLVELRSNLLALQDKDNELRKDYPNNSPTQSYWEYALYALVTICFISLLNAAWNEVTGSPKVYQNE